MLKDGHLPRHEMPIWNRPYTRTDGRMEYECLYAIQALIFRSITTALLPRDLVASEGPDSGPATRRRDGNCMQFESG